MPKLRQFKLSPRLFPPLPNKDTIIDIPEPPELPAKPRLRWIQLAMSLLMPAGYAVASLFFFRTSNLGMNIISMLFMATMSVTTALDQWSQRRAYAKLSKEQQEIYEKKLDSCRSYLQNIVTLQKKGESELNPSLDVCVERIMELSPRVWERTPNDADFLHARIGLGSKPITGEIRLPRSSNGADAVWHKLEALKEGFKDVPNLPILLPLQQLGITGLVGTGSRKTNLAQAIALHLATHHSPRDVKFVVLYPKSEQEQWTWMKSLPHVYLDGEVPEGATASQSQMDKNCLMADEVALADKKLTYVADMLGEAELDSREANSIRGSFIPPVHFVLFLADQSLYQASTSYAFIKNEGLELGAVPILLVNRFEDLPRESRGFVTFENGRSEFTYSLQGEGPLEFVPDEATEFISDFAQHIQTIELVEDSKVAPVPAIVPLIEMLGGVTVESLEISDRWKRNHPFAEEKQSLAVPVAMVAGNKLWSLNLRDDAGSSEDIAHGPHMVVGGTTGSGKSEFLQAYTASLIANFHPHWVSFLIIDYKGGGMANAFEGVPHLRGVITNLFDESSSQRALIALDSELTHRQLLFNKANVHYIDDYQALYAKNPEIWPPMPRLIVLVDEFAELKRDQPEFMQKLVSVARVGRSLGIHLILATQKPSGVVDDQIESNTRTWIGLKMAQRSDSVELLKSPIAARLPGKGRGIMRVGEDEIFIEFQSGFGGGKYRASDDASDMRTELEALMEHILELAKEEKLVPLPPVWLEPLPDELFLA